MDKIRVLIADDHAVVRMGLRTLLESKPNFKVVGEADDGVTAVRQACQLKPDVIILDLVMPNKDGADVTSEIRAALPATKILILTTFSDADGIKRALDAGANGALLKSAPNSELLEMLQKIAAGKNAVSRDVTRLFLKKEPIPKLSPRQMEVLEAVTRGLTNAEIATALNISGNSVKEYLSNIFSKIGAANRAEAVDIAHRKHLLEN